MLASVGLALMLLPSALGQTSITPFAHGREAAFSLEFDDSMDSQIKNALPLLAKYKIPATFYINPGRTNYPAAREVWEKRVSAAGHELGDHTMHHQDTVGAEQAAAEIGDAAKVIERVHGKPTLVPFATPGGVKWEIPDEDFRRILKENRLFFPGRKAFYQDGQGDILRFPEEALKEGKWGQLGFHGVGGEWLSTSPEALESVLKYLDAHRDRIWIAPTGTVWKYLQEKDALQGVELTPVGDRTLKIELRFLAGRLEPVELYDVPLTLRLQVPEGWSRATLEIDGKRTRVTSTAGTFDLDIPPAARAIRLVKA